MCLSTSAMPVHCSASDPKLLSYLRSLVVRAVHRHRTGVGSIPAGGPYS